MIVYVAIQWWWDGRTEADVIGVYSTLAGAVQEVENYTDWEPEHCDTDELVWGNEEYSIQIVDREVE